MPSATAMDRAGCGRSARPVRRGGMRSCLALWWYRLILYSTVGIFCHIKARLLPNVERLSNGGGGRATSHGAVLDAPSSALQSDDQLLAIERRFPALRGRFPRAQLTALPTPVRPLRRLGDALGVGNLWVKCDDESGPLYGGNKPRKLEFLLGDALADRKTTVLTFG